MAGATSGRGLGQGRTLLGAGATLVGAWGQGRTLLGAAQGAGATLVGAWGQGRTLLGAAQGAGATLVGAWGQGRTLLGAAQGAGATLVGASGQGRTLLGAARGRGDLGGSLGARQNLAGPLRRGVGRTVVAESGGGQSKNQKSAGHRDVLYESQTSRSTSRSSQVKGDNPLMVRLGRSRSATEGHHHRSCRGHTTCVPNIEPKLDPRQEPCPQPATGTHHTLA